MILYWTTVILTRASSQGSDSSDSNDTQTYLLKLSSQVKNKKKYLKTKRKRNATLAIRQNNRRELSKTEILLQNTAAKKIDDTSSTATRNAFPGGARDWLQLPVSGAKFKERTGETSGRSLSNSEQTS